MQNAVVYAGSDARGPDKPDNPVHILFSAFPPTFTPSLCIFLLVVVTGKVVSYLIILVIFHKLCLYLGPQSV